MQRHLEVAPLKIKPTVKNNVVDPFEVVGTDTVLFSVLTQVIVWATAEKSSTRTITNWPSTALAVVIVIVNVAAELFVTVVNLDVTGTVAALLEAVTALFERITLFKVIDDDHAGKVVTPLEIKTCPTATAAILDNTLLVVAA